MTLVSRPRLAGVAGFLRLFPAYTVSTATLFNFFGGRRFHRKGGGILRVITELNSYLSWVKVLVIQLS